MNAELRRGREQGAHGGLVLRGSSPVSRNPSRSDQIRVDPSQYDLSLCIPFVGRSRRRARSDAPYLSFLGSFGRPVCDTRPWVLAFFFPGASEGGHD